MLSSAREVGWEGEELWLDDSRYNAPPLFVMAGTFIGWGWWIRELEIQGPRHGQSTKALKTFAESPPSTSMEDA